MRCWCWQGHQCEAGQYLPLTQRTSARESAEVISRPPIIICQPTVSAAITVDLRLSSTAYLARQLAPAMRGVRASPNYVATAVVLVRIAVGVRVIATAISIRVPISIRVTVGVVVIIRI